ncbi:hypothetical protein [Roseibium sp. Sym1]|uniref:hypothetical protein n=1 Tax=Roseibium sp. Sym1 TaxID=3016006 RepID=UPI0022B2BC14|nr:hypothetical protein [Roseibium sp. Sym1]
MIVDSWKEHGAHVDLLFPVFFLCVFGSMFIFHLFRFTRLNRPPVEIGPDGIFDKRCMTKPVPWQQMRRIVKRTRSVNRGQLHYIVLFVEEETLPKLRGSHRWFRRYRKFRGLGDVAILASNLTGSHRKLMQVTKAYARAYGAPAAEEWS